MDKLKGIDILLEAWKLLGEEAPLLIVCGTGPMEEWCKRYVMDNSLNVKMLGFVQNDKAIQLIAESKAMILPTQWYEGFPMSIVEAYSVGTPVLGSKIGNTGSLIINGITGYTFDGRFSSDIEKTVMKFESSGISSCSVKDVFNKQYTENKNFEILEKIYSVIE